MNDLVFDPMTQHYLPLLEKWFEDAELRRRLGGMLPLQNFFDYVQSEPDYFWWVAVDADRPVGMAFMQIEPGEPQGFGFFVRPDLRRRGYGTRILKMLPARPEAASATVWQVGIEADNFASQRCVAALGFVPDGNGPDAGGFLQYFYHREPSGQPFFGGEQGGLGAGVDLQLP